MYMYAICYEWRAKSAVVPMRNICNEQNALNPIWLGSAVTAEFSS